MIRDPTGISLFVLNNVAKLKEKLMQETVTSSVWPKPGQSMLEALGFCDRQGSLPNRISCRFFQ